MATAGKRRRAKRVDVEDEADKPPSGPFSKNAKEAAEQYRQYLEWHNQALVRPPLPKMAIKGPGLRPNELFINSLYVPKDRNGKSRMSYIERAVFACRAKAASGKLTAAEILIDMYFDSNKNGDLQPARPIYRSR